MLIPGSHKLGMIDVAPQQETPLVPNRPSWMKFVAAKLQYPAPKELVTKLAKEKGIVAPKGLKGSILFFNGNILHASSSNISPFPRRSIFITYNPVTNIDLNFIQPRPNFLSNRDFTPLSVTTDCILKRF
ncbi:Ectoine dioxygenase [Nosema granulosis]|uniref:Ectoine dioxygenase n=1 Tax=Nosema granulosis TaxID=83296 RepID=A0A9P6GWA7_9MICR|nr:Ectoine dioxygenase [Nosema granulosis]